MYSAIQQEKTSNTKEIHVLSVNTLDYLINININININSNSNSNSNSKDIVSKWIILIGKFNNTTNYYATAEDLVFLSRLADNLTGAVNPVHINYYSGQEYFYLQKFLH
ncbi:hypothetical protein P3626_12865 [Vibrio parahaemolyticus]|nr:hypothetical protein [Vibrio parahaemolyticus]